MKWNPSGCRIPMLIGLCILTVMSSGASVRGQCLVDKLLNDEGVGGDLYGYSIAISGDTAIVGAVMADTPSGIDAGAAYIFERIGGSWIKQTTLAPNDAAAGDQFGFSVDIDGDTAVVGADWVDTPAGSNVGAAYVFVRSGGTWSLQQKILASDGAASDFFGVSIGISGDRMIVGAPGDNTPNGSNAGSAYIFVRQGATWTQEARLFANDAAASDFFSGYAVAIDGDTAVVGAIYDNTPLGGTDAGSVYVYVRNGTSWPQQDHLFASDGSPFDYFGAIVAISGNTIIAGADGDDTAAGVDAGSAYVFVRDGTTWSQQAHLYGSAPGAGKHFGWNVSVSGDIAAVGESADLNAGTGPEIGSVFVFRRSEDIWTEQAHLVPGDGVIGDDFGHCVSLSGATLFVGSDFHDTIAAQDAGAVYVYELDCHPGDMNCDNVVSPADVSHFVEAVLDSGTFTGCDADRADMNQDRLINGRDVGQFVTVLAGP